VDKHPGVRAVGTKEIFLSLVVSHRYLKWWCTYVIQLNLWKWRTFDSWV